MSAVVSVFRRTCLIVLSFAIAVALVAAHSQTTAPDLIIVNGNIYTVDPAFSTAQAVAIAAGQFIAVGRNEDIRRLATSSTKIVDVAGRTIVPGLADDHLHNAGGGD